MQSQANNGTVGTKLVKVGNARYMLVPALAIKHLRWRDNDLLVLRFAGEKAIVERVPSEKLAIIRTGEVERTI
jgi:hypothetical protein